MYSPPRGGALIGGATGSALAHEAHGRPSFLPASSFHVSRSVFLPCMPFFLSLCFRRFGHHRSSTIPFAPLPKRSRFSLSFSLLSVGTSGALISFPPSHVCFMFGEYAEPYDGKAAFDRIVIGACWYKFGTGTSSNHQWLSIDSHRWKSNNVMAQNTI